MTPTHRSPAFTALVALLTILLCSTGAVYAGPRAKQRPAAAQASAKDKKSSADRGRDKARAAAKQKNSAKEARDQRRVRKDERSAKDDKRASSKRDDANARRPQSRRERLAEARREAERRRREEAERRAELARQAAIARAAAIARQRAADQALRDEAAANILADSVTGEDLEVRRVAIAALGNHAGTVVVMDPKTGRVYTVVNQEWALRRGFKPCSTIKLVSGLAGLCENVINPVETVNISTGSYRLDLTDSLAFSNNTYFQKVGGYVGFERMMGYARQLGLGERTGINHANEFAGRVPVYKTGYAVNHMCSHGDDFEVTPIQLATLSSAIANGGSLLVPHLPRTPEEHANFKTEVRRRLNIPQEHLRRLIPGMIGAVNYGTARGAYDPLQTVAGKTGTCTGQGSWLGLFTSYAPVDDPRLAVVVVTRGSGERGRIAAAVAGKIYRGLGHRFGKGVGGAPLMANMPHVPVPRPKVNPALAAALSDEDAEANAAGINGEEETLNGTLPGGAPRSNVKSVLKPVYTRPTEMTTRPAAPAASGASSPGAGSIRPRRVLTTSP